MVMGAAAFTIKQHAELTAGTADAFKNTDAERQLCALFDSAFGNWWRYETKPNGGIGRQTKSVYLFIGMKTTGVHVKREHEIQTLVDRLSSGLHKCLRLCFGRWKTKA